VIVQASFKSSAKARLLHR